MIGVALNAARLLIFSSTPSSFIIRYDTILVGDIFCTRVFDEVVDDGHFIIS